MVSKSSSVRIILTLLCVAADIAVSVTYFHINPAEPRPVLLTVAVLLLTTLAIWLSPLLRAKALTATTVTLWFGFLAFCYLLRSQRSYALGLGSVCLLGVVLSIRRFRRQMGGSG
jgi:hypothetical protein